MFIVAVETKLAVSGASGWLLAVGCWRCWLRDGISDQRE